MQKHSTDDGFSLVEVIIAMFVLALLAVAILPALVTGLGISANQSATATAMRRLSALVDGVRSNPTCDTLADALSRAEYPDGSGRTFIVNEPGTVPASNPSPACASNTLVSVVLVASNGSGTLARLDADVYIP